MIRSILESKFLTIFLAVWLAFGVSLANLELSGSVLAAALPAPAAVQAVPAVIRVVSSRTSARIAVSEQSADAGQVCQIDVAGDLLQGTLGVQSFAAPADCFRLAPMRSEPETKSLTMAARPTALPQIAVKNFRYTVGSRYAVPPEPVQSPVAPMPIAVLLAVATFAAEVRLASRRQVREGSALFSALSLQQLQVFRC